MRTTIELDPALHETVRRQALRQNVSMAKLLGQLVQQGLHASTDPAPPSMRSGRFQVIAPGAAGVQVTSERMYKLIDDEGVL